jgi:hypothetical protein
MRAALAALLVVACVGGSAAAKPYREVVVRVEPPQVVTAITIRTVEGVQSVAVRDGKAFVPPDVPLPWVIGQVRFEPITYTEADLERGRPLLIRELGVLTGTFARPPGGDEKFTWLLQRSDTDALQEVEFAPRRDGAFLVRVASGLYEGALIGRAAASRIRSGILVKPGQTTDLGQMNAEPTATVFVRVTNSNGGTAVGGAQVIWDPPGEILNSGLSRRLYARRWTSTTDAQGRAVVQSVGPLPLSVRWRVEAKGFAPGKTIQTQLAQQRAVLPDIRLRPEAIVVARVRVPDGEDAFDDAILSIGEVQNERMRRFTTVAHADLRNGETTFRLPSYGRKRLSIQTSAGKTICYTDFDAVAQRTVVDLQPQLSEIYGRVSQGEEPISDAFIRLNDPDDPSVLLEQVPTTDDGQYRLRTFQSGSLRLYTMAVGGPGKRRGQVFQDVAVDGGTYRVDFDLPKSGLTLLIVDAKTGAPVEARIDTELIVGDGRTSNAGETDNRGRLEITAFGDGVAKLFVQAKGYRARTLELPMRETRPETTIRLEAAPEVRGRVVDIHGIPIPRARVAGGYDTEMQMDGHFLTVTDGEGRFSFDAAPDPGTTFYVTAARHGLGITYLQPGRENIVVLHPPSPGVVTLMPDNAPPSKVYMVMAAPAGGELIPLGALDDLADVNGMNPYQLQGSALDGTVVLPEFLGPGSYELFIALRGGSPYIYHRVGTVNAPIGRNVALAYKSR